MRKPLLEKQHSCSIIPRTSLLETSVNRTAHTRNSPRKFQIQLIVEEDHVILIVDELRSLVDRQVVGVLPRAKGIYPAT